MKSRGHSGADAFISLSLAQNHGGVNSLKGREPAAKKQSNLACRPEAEVLRADDVD